MIVKISYLTVKILIRSHAIHSVRLRDSKDDAKDSKKKFKKKT